jgi:hypothetical protein
MRVHKGGLTQKSGISIDIKRTSHRAMKPLAETNPKTVSEELTPVIAYVSQRFSIPLQLT